jgi:SAM-dependent methyltransferase
LNYDASLSLRLERLPLIGGLVRINASRFPEGVKYGDIVSGLPIPENSAASVYASHVLEHLCYDDFWIALENTLKVLKPGGVFRLIVPDLRARAVRYIEKSARGDPDAASKFLREAYLGKQARGRTLLQKMRQILGNGDHLWMWDELSMCEALRTVGFVDIRRCEFGDAADPAFLDVEAEDRFVDSMTGDIEVAIEAVKP